MKTIPKCLNERFLVITPLDQHNYEGLALYTNVNKNRLISIVTPAIQVVLYVVVVVVSVVVVFIFVGPITLIVMTMLFVDVAGQDWVSNS